MEKRIFIVKWNGIFITKKWYFYYETKSYNQVQTKFRTLFPKRLPPNKTTIWKKIKVWGGWHIFKHE